MKGLIKFVTCPSGSSTRREGDDLYSRFGFDLRPGVVARKNGSFVEFYNDRLAGEADGFEKAVQCDGAFNRKRRSIEVDAGGCAHFHWRSCSGNGQS